MTYPHYVGNAESGAMSSPHGSATIPGRLYGQISRTAGSTTVADSVAHKWPSSKRFRKWQAPPLAICAALAFWPKVNGARLLPDHSLTVVQRESRSRMRTRSCPKKSFGRIGSWNALSIHMVLLVVLVTRSALPHERIRYTFSAMRLCLYRMQTLRTWPRWLAQLAPTTTTRPGCVTVHRPKQAHPLIETAGAAVSGRDPPIHALFSFSRTAGCWASRRRRADRWGSRRLIARRRISWLSRPLTWTGSRLLALSSQASGTARSSIVAGFLPV